MLVGITSQSQELSMTSMTTTAQRLSGLGAGWPSRVAAAAALATAVVLLVLGGHLSGHAVKHDLQRLPAPAQHLLLGPSITHFLPGGAR